MIDTGKVKQQRYHEPSNTSTLKEVFVSQAEAVQRRGRAGRVRSGFCFRLYTKKRFDKKYMPLLFDSISMQSLFLAHDI